MIHTFGNKQPLIDDSCFVAWNAEVAGDVTLGAEVSVWHGASVRGDLAPIVVGGGSNVQDNAVLHVDSNVPLAIGENVTIGHGAILHGCTVGDGVLIGMGAIILNGASVGEGCIVGAGALVTSGKNFPERSLIIGSPAKAVREVSEEELEASSQNALHYRELIEDYKRQESEHPR